MKWTILGALKAQKEKKISPKELIQELQKNNNTELNLYITDLYDKAIQESEGKDFVIPVALKDNFFLKGERCTAGSKILSKFIAPFDSTIVTRLKDIGCVFVGKANMDEFACGSSGKTSAFGLTNSPLKNKNGDFMSPGGTSSGSAAAVCAGACLASTGSDTGGSIRQPAAWTGLFGLKPTYGVLSRYGIVEFGSALDSPGYLTHTLEDMEFLFNKTIGIDSNDYTSVNYVPEKTLKKIGIISNLMLQDKNIHDKFMDYIKKFESIGYEIKYYDLPELEKAISLYYVLAPAELASNLARYDGRFFGSREKFNSLDEMFLGVRSEDFGEEVQRRILIGNYILHAANQDDFYGHARRSLQFIWEKIEKIFQEVDVLFCPTAPEGMTVKETLNPDPIKMYQCDIYTCMVNMLGLCALSIPFGCYENGLPMALQIISKPFGENLIFNIARKMETI